jgi:hypothetical protein
MTFRFHLGTCETSSKGQAPIDSLIPGDLIPYDHTLSSPHKIKDYDFNFKEPVR